MNAPATALTSIKSINWNLAWREAKQQRGFDRKGNGYWNRRAQSFAAHTKENGYSLQTLRLIDPKPEWTVLDVGCGPGTLAMPLSCLVRHVTAIDFSDAMIAILEEKCWKNGITNVTAKVLGWEDDWEAERIGEHDMAIASRSLVVEDLQAALLKLDSKARHRVVISSLVGDGPFDRRIFDAIGRNLDRGPDYIYVYNLLNQMGFYANITFVKSGDTARTFLNLDDAVEGFLWMIDNITEQEKRCLREYLERHLVKKGDHWSLSYEHTVRWAVISWDK